jgi:putative aldouronate transport system substrate-binding protein
MKRFLSLAMAVMMILSLTACGGNKSTTSQESKSDVTLGATGAAESDTSQQEGTASTNSTIDFEEDPYTLTVCYPVLSETQPDLPLIQEAINEITLREINVKVQFEAVGLFSMANVYALKASSQEKMDLMMLMPGYNYMANFVTSNMIRPIDEELNQWGSSIKEIIGDYLVAGNFKGQQFGIPQNKDFFANGYGFNISVPLCEKYNIDIDSIKTIEDLEAAFEIIHQNEPDITVVAPEQSRGLIASSLIGKIDALGTTVATLEQESDGSLKVVASVDREETVAAAKKVREWYEKGYISRDVTTAQESGSQMLGAGKVFATASPSLGAAMGGKQNGVSYRGVLMDDGVTRITGDSQMLIWAVSSSCERPDKAIQFLNLAFENEELGNLFQFGIKDNHYKLLEDGVVEIDNAAGWTNNWNLLGDYNKMYVRSDTVEASGVSAKDFRKLVAQWNDNVKTSPAYGFTFDPVNVRTEIAACDSVIDEYGKAIGNGAVDPEKELPKQQQKLRDAGIQTILDELQKQLDEWTAAQK